MKTKSPPLKPHQEKYVVLGYTQDDDIRAYGMFRRFKDAERARTQMLRRERTFKLAMIRIVQPWENWDEG